MFADYVVSGLECYFPLPKMVQKQAFLSASTFRIMQERAIVAHAFGATAAKLAGAVFRFACLQWRAFACTSTRFGRPWWCSVRGPAAKRLCLKQHQLCSVVCDLTRRIKIRVTADLITWCQLRSRDLEEAALGN